MSATETQADGAEKKSDQSAAKEADPFQVEYDKHYRSFGNSELDRPVGGWPQEKWWLRSMGKSRLSIKP